MILYFVKLIIPHHIS